MELAKATNNFSPERKIGEGGFTKVYMGRLPDGREVAIKRTLETSGIGIIDIIESSASSAPLATSTSSASLAAV